jgi:hypothetical protein
MVVGSDVNTESCVVCGVAVDPEFAMRCMICRSAFCAECGVTGYGRTFCSPRCRDFFFFGEADEADD